MDSQKLRKIASYQRWLLFCILLTLVIIGVAGYVEEVMEPYEGETLKVMVGLAYIAIAVAALVLSILLAMNVYKSAVFGVIIACMVVVPFLGLLFMAHVNGRATSLLRENGVKVGFLGANPGEIPYE